MRKFIDKITPSFIRSYNTTLLKNAPLGWQLQLPTITWLWFLVTLLTVPIPFLINQDKSGDDDIIAVILIAVLTAVLVAFLFVYILIQFNNTKTFGRRVFLNGLKEQFAYLYVFMLCSLHIIFYPLIVDIRKSNLMTAEEIRKEAVVYNQASFYFMGEPNAYRYFPSDETFLHYKKLELYGQYGSQDEDYNGEQVASREHYKETYYIEHVKPMMRAYFRGETEILDPIYIRNLKNCPKLYMVEGNNLYENYYDYGSSYARQLELDTLHYDKYQLKNKSDAERLKDIIAFIKLYNKYSTDEYFSLIHFEAPDEILQKYNSNSFSKTFHDLDGDISSDHQVMTVEGKVEVEESMDQLSHYRISNVHGTIARAKFYKWEHLLMRLTITFFVALCLSILLFLFKNARLREFILMFVYSALLALAVIILTIILFGDEDFGVHVVMIVFFIGIYFSFLDQRSEHYSSLKTIFILLSNATFAFAPIFLFMYFHEYLDIGQIEDSYEYCKKNPVACDEHYAMVDLIQNCSLWGGIAFYLFIGSTFYKKVYERIQALPLAK
jgi:hypothetical protein